MMAALARVVVAAGGGWIAVRMFGTSHGLFVALAAALVIYGVANAATVAGGAWFATARKELAPSAQAS
jgi:hypothetical protein